jgi:hypothetical protein
MDVTSRKDFSPRLVMFQSTPRQRGDASDKRNSFHNAVSIHAQEIYNDLDDEVVFQSTPRQGTTPALPPDQGTSLILRNEVTSQKQKHGSWIE